MRSDVHDGCPWHLSDPSLQVLVTGSHDIASVLFDSIYDAVISVGAFVIAFQPLETRVFGYSQSYPVLDAKLLKLSNHAVSNVGDAFAEKTVHAGFEDV